MAYNPGSTAAVIHGVDIMAVTTDPRLCKDPERREKTRNGTSCIISLPTFADLGPAAGWWQNRAVRALEEAGFELFWKWGVKNDKNSAPLWGLQMKVDLPEESWREVLPDFAEKVVAAFKPLFDDEKLFLNWSDAVEDAFSDRSMKKLDRNAFSDDGQPSTRGLNAALSDRLKLLALPLVMPYIDVKGEQEQDRKTRQELNDAISEPGQTREGFLRDLSELGLLHGSFFSSSVQTRFSGPWVVSRPGEGETVKIGLPFTIWRSAGALVKKMADNLARYKDLPTEIRFGKEGTLPYDPTGSRSMFNATFACKAGSYAESVQKYVAETLSWEPGEPDPRPLVMPLSDERFVSETPYELPRGESFVKAGDEENKWRKISPSIYVHLTIDDVERAGGPDAVLKKMADWAQENGVSMQSNYKADYARSGGYLSAYVNDTDKDKMTDASRREELATKVRDLLGDMGIDAKLECAVSRLKTYVRTQRMGTERKPSEMAVKIPKSTDEVGPQTKGLAFVRSFLTEAGWKEDSGKLKRESLFVLPCNAKGDDVSKTEAEMLSKAEKDLAKLGDALKKHPYFVHLIENRSPRDERNWARKLQVDRTLSNWLQDHSHEYDVRMSEPLPPPEDILQDGAEFVSLSDDSLDEVDYSEPSL